MSKQSLQEQLLKAGLVSSAQAKSVKSEKHKSQKQQQKNKISAVDEAKLLAKQTLEEKAQKDRELNHQLKALAEQKALSAQIQQLIEPNIIEPENQEIAYHFTDGQWVKTLYVDEDSQKKLSTGRLAITKLGKRYVLVSVENAKKILERAPDYFVFLNISTASEITEDPYAAYAVPDDLIW
ncbi:MAG: DUF2058 domain-containing protein [Methylococcales bacterium]